MRTVKVNFPGGKKVDARVEGFTVHTDQRLEHGGEQTAPSPFDLFFVSIATCAGISALEFCHKAKLPEAGLEITMHAHRHPVQQRYDRILIEVTPPPGLNAAQTKALLKSTEDCAVRNHMFTPPAFDVVCTCTG